MKDNSISRVFVCKALVLEIRVQDSIYVIVDTEQFCGENA